LASRLVVLVIAALVAGVALVAAAPGLCSRWAGAVVRWVPLPGRLRERALGLTETFFTTCLVLREQRTVWLLMLLTAAVAALDVARVAVVFRAMGIGLGLPFVAFAYLGAAMLGMALLIPGGVGVKDDGMAVGIKGGRLSLGLIALGLGGIFVIAVAAGYLMGQTSFRTTPPPPVLTMPVGPSISPPGAPGAAPSPAPDAGAAP